VLFATILYVYRNEIRADQELRSRGTGNSRATNPYFHIRQRFQKLYGVFRPDFTYWRLVLTLRKFGIAAVAIMFTSAPGFQAWYFCFSKLIASATKSCFCQFNVLCSNDCLSL
jgi:hypothetical protein